MKKKTLTTLLVVVFSIINAWAEPGGTYTLTGKEKGITEIIKADMEKYPDLYKGENLKIYIGRFKSDNGIGRRNLRPGSQLCFPETRVSIEKKKSKREEETKQQEEAQQAIYISFTEKFETDWIAERAFMELDSKLKRKGFWEEYWPTEIDGRCSQDGKIEYKLKCEPVPSESRYEWFWWFSMDEKDFLKKKEQYKDKGLEIVHEQLFTLSSGEKRYQAVWHMQEG